MQILETVVEKKADIIEVADDILTLIPRTIPAWIALTQLAPQYFAGFAGFVSNTPRLSNTMEGGSTGTVPAGTNSGQVTVVSAPFTNPSTGQIVGAGLPVSWTLSGGPNLSGNTSTDTTGTATVSFAAGTLMFGSYSLDEICVIQTTPPVPLISNQKVPFTVQS